MSRRAFCRSHSTESRCGTSSVQLRREESASGADRAVCLRRPSISRYSVSWSAAMCAMDAPV